MLSWRVETDICPIQLPNTTKCYRQMGQGPFGRHELNWSQHTLFILWGRHGRYGQKSISAPFSFKTRLKPVGRWGRGLLRGMVSSGMIYNHDACVHELSEFETISLAMYNSHTRYLQKTLLHFKDPFTMYVISFRYYHQHITSLTVFLVNY